MGEMGRDEEAHGRGEMGRWIRRHGWANAEGARDGRVEGGGDLAVI